MLNFSVSRSLDLGGPGIFKFEFSWIGSYLLIINEISINENLIANKVKINYCFF